MADKIPDNSPEFPSPGKQRVAGEFLFLAMRTDTFANLPLVQFQNAFQPAIDHKQFHIFHFDGVARGVITWARLTAGAESRFVRGEGLRHEDWNKGDRFWIVDMIAPYKGVGSFVSQWARKEGNLPTRKINYLRASRGTNKVQKVIMIDHDAPHRQGVKIMSKEEFLAR